MQEIASLEENLPNNPAIWLRFDEETPQFLRALITAPTQTPYSLGLFCFDIFVPDAYPLVPPKMQLLTTGRGTVRFSPNLYADGKVCLSLLNTWNGPKWNPAHSTLLQCLVSLQGLILGVEHPYYLEPGHGGWEGHISEAPPTNIAAKIAAAAAAATAGTSTSSPSTTAAAMPSLGGLIHPSTASTVPIHIQQFEDRIRLGTAKFAMLDMIQSLHDNNNNNNNSSSNRYLRAFTDIIAAHFHHCQERIVEETLAWAKAMKLSAQRRQFKQVAKQPQDALAKLPPLPPVAAATTTEKDEDATMDDSNHNSKDAQSLAVASVTAPGVLVRTTPAALAAATSIWL